MALGAAGGTGDHDVLILPVDTPSPFPWSGILFGLKHLYVWWRVPYLVPVGIALGFIYGPMGSLPLTIFFHWLGNTL